MKYDYRYGVTINNKHTFRDYRLLPTSPPVISAPEPKIYTEDIPGMDGVLDLTEALTGDVQFGMRTVTLEYMFYGRRDGWRTTFRRLLTAIHGRSCTLILDEEPDFTYTGRLQLGEPEYDGKRGVMHITIEGELYPWPTEAEIDPDDWLWNPFNFDHDTPGEIDAITGHEYFRMFASYDIAAEETRENVVLTVPSKYASSGALYFSWEFTGERDARSAHYVQVVCDTYTVICLNEGERYTSSGIVASSARLLTLTNTFNQPVRLIVWAHCVSA